MLVSLYKHIQGKYFDDQEKIIIFPSGGNYAENYAAYIAPAKYWEGEGKTYNIENFLVCEVDKTAYDNTDGRAVYLSTSDNNGGINYYYITDIEALPQKVRLYLSEDTFATFYEPGRQQGKMLITRSTQTIDPDRIIKIPEESQEIPRYKLSRNAAQGFTPNSLAFLLKIKQQAGGNSGQQAYSVNLWYVNISSTSGNTALQRLKKTFTNISNSFEVKQTPNSDYYPIEIEEIYLLPNRYINPNVSDELIFYLHYVDVNAGLQDLEIRYVEKFIEPINLNLAGTTAAYSKLIIGNNEIELPKNLSWGNSTVRGELNFTYNLTDFDIILNIENNEPRSIKEYFKCEVANSTQETSLQKMARQASFLMNLGTTVAGGALSIATGGAYGAAVGFGALAGSLQAAGQQIIDDKTKSQLPATHFTSTGFSVFLNSAGEFRQGFIFHEFYLSNEISQGALNILRNGIEWYNMVENLESLISLPSLINTATPVPGARNYVEGVLRLTDMPANKATQIENLIIQGVELINGES